MTLTNSEKQRRWRARSRERLERLKMVSFFLSKSDDIGLEIAHLKAQIAELERVYILIKDKVL